MAFLVLILDVRGLMALHHTVAMLQTGTKRIVNTSDLYLKGNKIHNLLQYRFILHTV